MLTRFAALVALSACCASSAVAVQCSVQRGRALVEQNCIACHAVGEEGESPLAAAPPFRDLHERYAVESLAEALAEGIVTGHDRMPEFELNAEQIGDVISYLKSLER